MTAPQIATRIASLTRRIDRATAWLCEHRRHRRYSEVWATRRGLFLDRAFLEAELDAMDEPHTAGTGPHR
jgi:uncharacterized membrane protein YbaN (DUF454 family)